VNISPERAIDAFWDGLIWHDFREELGRCNPETIDHLMSLANEWLMGKILLRSLGVVVDQQTTTLTKKISSTPALGRKDAETAMKTRIRQIW
jgi:hypothetical protein